jgi:ribonuclease HI
MWSWGSHKFPDSTVYRWYINCGEGTNTKAELMGVWATLTLANHWNIQKLQLMGDSKVVIDWLNHKGNLHAIDIEGWKRRTKELTTIFQGICFHHIFREFNKEADRLIKTSPLGTERQINLLHLGKWDDRSSNSYKLF